MTPTIKKIIKDSGFIICPHCYGEGDIDSFCGHYTTVNCYMCGGHGVVKSLTLQKHTKPCNICKGKGCGGCNDKGFHEWESYECF